MDETQRKNLVSIGGPSARVKVTLRIFGDDLEPDSITKQIGCPPTTAFKKGDLVPDKRDHRISETGKWLVEMTSSGELEPVVHTLIAKLTPQIDVWRNLVSKFRVDIYCGIFFKNENLGGGFALSPGLLHELAERGIGIGFDLYFA